MTKGWRGDTAEDKATIFESLMVGGSEFKGRLASDPVLAAKVDYVRKETIHFCPDMKEFWERQN